MIEKKKDLIIFDFFGVISSEVAPHWLEKYFDNKTALDIKNNIISKVDSGEISEEELHIILSKLANIPPDIVKMEWFELVHINTELVNYIIELKEKYLVALLSNASSTFLRSILDTYKLNSLFDTIIISSEVHLTKPNIDIYNLLLNKLNVPAKQAIMIDDNTINIEGAKKAGIDGIIYNDFKSFLTDFNKKT